MPKKVAQLDTLDTTHYLVWTDEEWERLRLRVPIIFVYCAAIVARPREIGSDPYVDNELGTSSSIAVVALCEQKWKPFAQNILLSQ